MEISKAFSVVFEDNHLLLVNKASGILVQGDKTGDMPLSEYAKAYLKEKYQKPGAVFVGVAHRIDRPVSGLVVFAKTSKALERMNKLFQTKEIEKTYWAVVEGHPSKPEGHLVHYLKKDETKNKTTAYSKETPGALHSELHYKVLAHQGGKSLLEVKPITGRPHQIRVQLASMKCPIVGDLKYGASQALPDASILLHAYSIQFIHPVKKEPMQAAAPLPDKVWWKSWRL